MCSSAMAQQRIPANFRGFAKRRAAMATLPALRSGTPLCLLTSHVVCFRARTLSLSLSDSRSASLSLCSRCALDGERIVALPRAADHRLAMDRTLRAHIADHRAASGGMF